MKALGLCFCILISAVTAQANDWNFSLGLQQIFRPETTTDDYFEFRSFQGFSLGMAYKKWWFELENNQTALTTGSAFLSTERRVSQTAVWTRKEMPLSLKWLNLLLGGGVGTYQESVTTTFGPSQTEVRSDDFLTAAFGLGFRVNIPWAWISLESRAEMMQNWSPNPLLSLNAKLGFWF
jgi:hypothetical protein